MTGMSRVRKFFALLLIALGHSAISRGADFRPATVYPVGSGPNELVAGDFDGDGKPDLIVANENSANLSILIGDGSGSFRPARILDIAGTPGTSPITIASGDFNGDRKLDLAVFNGKSLSLYLGNGDGTFGPALPVAGSGSDLHAADFNSDGKVDLITELGLLLGNGDGTFQPQVDVGADVILLVADFNGDGKPDLVTPGGIMLGDGRGAFQPPIAALPTPGNCGIFCTTVFSNWVAGDFNGDGKLDLAYATATRRCLDGCFTGAYSTQILMGNGDGSFRAGGSVGPGGAFLVTDDFNGDSKLDIAAAPTIDQGNSLIHFLLGRGDGTFSATFDYDMGSGFRIFLGTDLNGDKLPDLVSADLTEATVSVALNASGTSGADLAVILSSIPTEIPLGGGDLNYAVSVLNEGPSDGSGDVLTVTVPAGLRFVSAQPSVGTCSGTITVTCDLGAMPEPSTATVQLRVTPTDSGTFTNAINVTGEQPDPDAENNLASFTISVVKPDFAIDASSSSLSLSPGGQATENLYFPAQGGYSASISLACAIAGPAPMPTCAIVPSTVNPGDSATLTVDAGTLVSQFDFQRLDSHPPWLKVLLSMMLIALILAFVPDQRRPRSWAFSLLLVGAAILPVACGGGSSARSGANPRGYTVTVTATSGTIEHSTNVDVIVN